LYERGGNVKAVILAAGSSQRLRPHTNFMPKCLLTVAGTSMLERSIRALVRTGAVDELVMVTGYRETQIHRAVAGLVENMALEVRFRSNRDYASTNNGYSLRLAADLVAGHEFVLLDSDIVFDQGVLDAVVDSEHESALALRPSDDLGAEEVKIEEQGDGRILRVGASGESIGIERFSAAASTALFAALERRIGGLGLVNEYYEASFQEIIDAGTAIHSVDVGRWYSIEIDTPHDLEAAERTLLERQHRQQVA
jgi:choline kinase